jgi:hypothetical protein
MIPFFVNESAGKARRSIFSHRQVFVAPQVPQMSYFVLSCPLTSASLAVARSTTLPGLAVHGVNRGPSHGRATSHPRSRAAPAPRLKRVGSQL